MVINMTDTAREEDAFAPIWELYGLRSNPFSTSPLSVKGGIIPIDTFYGRASEIQTIKSLLRSSGGNRIIISGEAGVGKTSFVNFIRWQAMKNKYFTHFREISVQPEWTANDFILNTLSSFYSSINLLGLEQKLDKQFRERLKGIFSQASYSDSYSANIAGFGGGIGRSKSTGTQNITYDFLAETFQIFTEQIITKLDFNQIIVHYNNLEIYEEDDEMKFKKIFNKIRDFLQTPNVHFIFIGDLNISAIIQSIPRVSQIFSSTPIILETFSKKDIKTIINERIRFLKIPELKQTFPCDDSVIDILHSLYNGNIRNIFNSLSIAVSVVVKQYPIKLGKDDIVEILNNMAEKNFAKKLTDSEKKVLIKMLKKNEITNMEISKELSMKPQNVSKYINRLKELGCVTLKRIDGTQKFYTVNHSVKWLLLKPSKFIENPVEKEYHDK